MGRAVALRDDFCGLDLRRLAKSSKDAGQSRRLLALAEIYNGGKRLDAARVGSVGLQVIRGWVLRFNAKGPAGLIDGKADGPAAQAERRSAPGACAACGKWSNPVDPRCCALAPQGFGALALRGIPDLG